MEEGFSDEGRKKRYIDSYNALFEEQADAHGIEGRRLWLPIDTLANQDVDAALRISRRGFKDLEISREQMAGMCFSRVCDASFALCQANVRHSITVGNVFVDNRPYYDTTPDSIAREVEKGYVHAAPAMAHSWITLENGVLLDFTLSYAIARREGKRLPKLIKGIYRSDFPPVRGIRHIPMLLGPMYDLLVVTMPNDAGYEKGCDWVSMILNLINGREFLG